jgi:predicted DNA-binding WGR domain protein
MTLRTRGTFRRSSGAGPRTAWRSRSSIGDGCGHVTRVELILPRRGPSFAAGRYTIANSVTGRACRTRRNRHFPSFSTDLPGTPAAGVTHLSRNHAQPPGQHARWPSRSSSRCSPPGRADPHRPERNEWRFYRVAVWPDPCGRALLTRQWGSMGAPGRIRLDPYPGAAINALARLARAKRRRRYQSLLAIISVRARVFIAPRILLISIKDGQR